MIHLQATDDSPSVPLFYYICAELVYIELGLGSSSTVYPVFRGGSSRESGVRLRN